MNDNGHPRVIVDDDYLDLRNPGSKQFSRRPTSVQSKHRDSTSSKTQRRASTSKNVLPGLQRFLNTYNQKNADVSGYKKGKGQINRPVDSRFRRRVDIKAVSSRSDSKLQMKGKKNSQSSELSDHSTSSKSENENEEQSMKHPERQSKSYPKNNEVKTNRENQNKNVNSAPKNENETEEQSMKHLERLSKSCLKHDETKINKVNQNKNVRSAVNKSGKKSEMRPGSADMKMYGTFDKTQHECEKPKDINASNCEEKKFQGVQTVKIRECCTNTTSRDAMESVVNECAVINKHLRKLDWYDPTLLLPNSYHNLPTFKKSWTIPSLPLLKRDMLWTRNYNALCAKVDRKTYEFDTDDTDSAATMDRLSCYSSLFRTNYMNLIFCLGCLSGIFLMAGILTASEINSDFFGRPEPSMKIFDTIFKQITYPMRMAFLGVEKILTFTSKMFQPSIEPPTYWRIF